MRIVTLVFEKGGEGGGDDPVALRRHMAVKEPLALACRHTFDDREEI